MISNQEQTQNQNQKTTWTSLIWRLLLTAFLLISLTLSGLNQFDSITTGPETQVLPTTTTTTTITAMLH